MNYIPLLRIRCTPILIKQIWTSIQLANIYMSTMYKLIPANFS